MPTSDEIILHHYDASPFSNKVRLLLGLKEVTWHSVLTPNMMPKPDLVPLTGGYRRAPVMQIGADIYCDSQAIMAGIERRSPDPKADFGASWPVNIWADRMWFQHSVAIIFGLLGDHVDPAFMADREKLSGRPFDIEAMAAAAEPSKAQWRAQAAWLEKALVETGEGFLFGSVPSVGDLAAHMNIWFVASVFPDVANELLAGLPYVQSWREAIEELGEGSRSECSGEQALAVATRSEPVDLAIDHDLAFAMDVAVGDEVIVMADDYGRDPISGTLLGANSERIVIRRSDDIIGTTHVHFPRLGFVIAKAAAT
ncbi:glutathione S-transferase family protein [Roseibium sp.]|uniref:glutathione S-transferase family protein n=1 Tax=Roseibium sp. TaxID=1936156 RepID=UPI003297078A